MEKCDQFRKERTFLMGQHLKNENNDGHDAENDQLI